MSSNITFGMVCLAFTPIATLLLFQLTIVGDSTISIEQSFLPELTECELAVEGLEAQRAKECPKVECKCEDSNPWNALAFMAFVGSCWAGFFVWQHHNKKKKPRKKA